MFYPRHRLLLLTMLAVILGVWLSGVFETGAPSSAHHLTETVPLTNAQEQTPEPIEEVGWSAEELPPDYIYDTLPTGEMLFSKDTFRVTAEPLEFLRKTDLWLKGRDTRERRVGGAVAWARFSPDGKKLAFVTAEQELCVETLGGKHLGQVPNVTEAHWENDGAGLTFLAVPSSEYQDLRQIMRFEIASARIVQPEMSSATNSLRTRE